ncbi:hypothetical protein CGLO_14930 [Colletotrichum gloeosporioides Cg-14]|uniref:Uncharacterized protein n=1 Tax=Colletotrichum gloeosporioides (strain Cg-14) TaxID=1237896 RepID=T0JZW0_COLGC|nr:hypothetical protein CGLO_14930 [Colletotrichum gloeosporioides Cg-14]
MSKATMEFPRLLTYYACERYNMFN